MRLKAQPMQTRDYAIQEPGRLEAIEPKRLENVSGPGDVKEPGAEDEDGPRDLEMDCCGEIGTNEMMLIGAGEEDDADGPGEEDAAVWC